MLCVLVQCHVVCASTQQYRCTCVSVFLCPQEVLESEDIAAAVLYALAAPARVDVSWVWRSDCSCACVCMCVCACVCACGVCVHVLCVCCVCVRVHVRVCIIARQSVSPSA